MVFRARLATAALAVLLIATTGFGQVKRLNNVRYADQFPGADAGAKIVAAFADCPSQGCTVIHTSPSGVETLSTNVFSGVSTTKPLHLVLGPGTYSVSATQSINDCYSCSIEGVAGSQVLGTRFKWVGSSNGTVFSVVSSSWSIIKDISIDGNLTAGTGFSMQSASGSSSAQQNEVHNLYVTGVTGSPGRAVYVGSSTNGDVSQNTWDRIHIFSSNYGIYQEGQQTVQNWFSGIEIFYSLTGAARFIGGDIHVTNALFISENSGAFSDIYVGASCAGARFINIDAEVNQGSSTRKFYEFAAGTRSFDTEIIGGRIKWEANTGKPIDWNQSGSLNIVGLTIQSDVGTNTGVINLQNGGSGISDVNFTGTNIAANLFSITVGNGVMSHFSDSQISGAVFSGASPLPAGIYSTDQVAAFELSGPVSRFFLTENDQVADSKKWLLEATGGNLTIGTCTDLNSCTTVLKFVRSSGRIAMPLFACPSGQTAPITINDTGELVKGSCS